MRAAALRLAFRLLLQASPALAAELVSWAAGELAARSMWREMMGDVSAMARARRAGGGRRG